jgi:hypothetical protein
MNENRITIHSNLSGFTLIDIIIDVGPSHIAAIKHFDNASFYLGLESLAQLGAYHVRYLTDFSRHAFLLKISRCTIPQPPRLSGEFNLHGALVSKSQSAFSYTIQAHGKSVQIEGTFLFATADYDRNLQKDVLQNHYRKVFACLRRDSAKS